MSNEKKRKRDEKKTKKTRCANDMRQVRDQNQGRDAYTHREIFP